MQSLTPRLACSRRSTNWIPEYLTTPEDLPGAPAPGWSIPLRDIYGRTGLAG